VRALFEFRAILEPAAIRMVTIDGAANPKLLVPFEAVDKNLEAVADEFGSADRGVLAPRFYDIAEQFDQAIIDSCHNPMLASTIADRRGQTARLRGIAHGDPNRMERSLEEHQRMCKAILRGDADTAARELADHLAQTLNTILENLTRGVGQPGGLDIEILPLGQLVP
jgi:DNA-binding GntR family transcriptional regulator